MPIIRDYKDIIPERIMATGKGGTGKTTLFETLPGKRLMLAFERNTITAIKKINPRSLTEFELFAPTETNFTVERVPNLKKGGTYNLEMKQRSKAYADFETYCERRLSEGYFDQFDWIGCDGATQMARAMLDDVLARAGRLGYIPELSDYNPVKFQMERVLRFFCALPCGFYFTVHIGDIFQDAVTLKLVEPLLLPGDLRTVAATMFSQVFRTAIHEREDGKLRFMIQTRPTPKLEGPRTSIRDLQISEDVTIDNVSLIEMSGLGKILTEKAGFRTKGQIAKAQLKLVHPEPTLKPEDKEPKDQDHRDPTTQ